MLRLGLILLVVPMLALMAVYLQEQSVVDACLDQGGSFDYAKSFCDMENKQPFVPLMVRQPLLVNGGMLVSLLGFIFCLKGLLWRPR